jgi:hypothetical protein
MRVSKRPKLVTRRALLRAGATAGVGAVLISPSSTAQESSIAHALQSMSPLTGTELPMKWAEPTTVLVSVILDDSKSLRQLDLGEVEPATFFTAD